MTIEFPSKGFEQQDLDRFFDTAFIVDEELLLLFSNKGWYRFAAENGGEPAISRDWSRGKCILDAIAEPRLRSFYESLYRECLRSDFQDKRPLRHEYECSSPNIFRKFVMNLYRISAPAGILVVNAKLIECSIDQTLRIYGSASEITEIEKVGIIRQCAHCRLVQCAGKEDKWVWIPQWVERCPENVSHTLCNICLNYYYPLGN